MKSVTYLFNCLTPKNLHLGISEEYVSNIRGPEPQGGLPGNFLISPPRPVLTQYCCPDHCVTQSLVVVSPLCFLNCYLTPCMRSTRYPTELWESYLWVGIEVQVSGEQPSEHNAPTSQCDISFMKLYKIDAESLIWSGSHLYHTQDKYSPGYRWSTTNPWAKLLLVYSP